MNRRISEEPESPLKTPGRLKKYGIIGVLVAGIPSFGTAVVHIIEAKEQAAEAKAHAKTSFQAWQEPVQELQEIADGATSWAQDIDGEVEDHEERLRRAEEKIVELATYITIMREETSFSPRDYRRARPRHAREMELEGADEEKAPSLPPPMRKAKARMYENIDEAQKMLF